MRDHQHAEARHGRVRYIGIPYGRYEYIFLDTVCIFRLEFALFEFVAVGQYRGAHGEQGTGMKNWRRVGGEREGVWICSAAGAFVLPAGARGVAGKASRALCGTGSAPRSA